MKSWLDNVIAKVQADSKAVSRVDMPKPALQRYAAQVTGPSAGEQAAQGTWSNLLLQATKSVTDKDGNTHHTVEPAPEPKAEKAKDDQQIDPKIAESLRHPGVDFSAFGMGGHDTTYQAAADKEQAVNRFKMDRANRNELLDTTQATTTVTDPSKLPETKAMSTDEYNALSDRQRAAVDFNTSLATAVKHDLSNQKDFDKLSTAKQGAYAEASKELFGKDRGSDLYAPETLAVLRQLKLDDHTADLDDYLGLKTAITDEDLGALAKGTEANRGRAAILNPSDETRADFVNGVADNAEKLQQSIAKGSQMLQTFSATAASARAGDATRLGASPDSVTPMLGFNTADSQHPTDTLFQQYFEVLSNKKVNASADEILADARANLSKDDYNKFFDYARARSDNSENFQLPLGDTKGGNYRSPDEFRDLLGLGK